MGVSMGIIKPMSGKVASDFLRESDKYALDKKTIKRCQELAKK